ncbi:hypothetical protein SAMN04489722_101221 [Algibacter lectus]|nr:hypothetical protein SAMN04489722_101221 [Algibacter lectus]
MKTSRIKNSITYSLLVLFLTMKMAGIHALLHIDDKDHAPHCVICDHTTANNLTPAITPNLQDFKIENTEPIVQREIIKNYNFIISCTIATDQLFSRPPPFLL